ncbi:MAG: hypothetical protein EHM13_15575 [Acidobacteria bacterium]|nr:MAG: hypothetical protein EHM13_15575 [Acidobacteriota bacterium]
MNNDLIRSVADKIGVSDDKASAAVEAVLSYVKNRLPQPVATQLDNVVGKGGSGGEGISGAAESIFGSER